MPTDEVEFLGPWALLSILRPDPADPEQDAVWFDDLVSQILVRLAPADPEGGPVVGVRLFTPARTWSALLMLTPGAAAALAVRLAGAVAPAGGAGAAALGSAPGRPDRVGGDATGANPSKPGSAGGALP